MPCEQAVILFLDALACDALKSKPVLLILNKQDLEAPGNAGQTGLSATLTNEEWMLTSALMHQVVIYDITGLFEEMVALQDIIEQARFSTVFIQLLHQ